MVLVRSPKRGPWLRPASPTQAPAAAGAAPPATTALGELTGGGVRGQAPAGAEAHTSPFLPAAAGGTNDAAVVVAAAGAAAAAEGRDQEYRKASFTSISSRCRPPTTAQNISPPPSQRKSTSGVGFFFSEGATHSSSAACRRPLPPAACSEACTAAATSEARTAAAAAETRHAAAIVRGPASAAREATHAALPFSRSAARRLARIPVQAAAALPAAGQTAAVAAAGARGAGGAGGGGLRARRVSSLRRSSRVPATTEASTNSKEESLQPQATHAAAVSSNASVPKRVRYAQRSPLRGRGVVASFPLPRKPLTRASLEPPAAAECQSPTRRTTNAAGGAAGAICSPREKVSGAKTSAASMDPPLPAAVAGVVPPEATTSRPPATPAPVKKTDTQSQQPLLQHNVQAVELLQQLPATRALHDYVQEATRSELLKRHHREREAPVSAADGLGSGTAVNSLASPGAAAATTYQPGSAAGPPVAKRPALATVAAAAAAAAAAATPLAADTAAGALRSQAASSLNSSAAGPASLVAAVTAGAKKTSAATGGPATAAVASAAAANPVAAAVCGQTPLAPVASPAAAVTGWSSYCSSDKLQPLVLPRTAEELLQEWSPTVDNVIQRLCDVREEEKQVTQFIILEGRALRVLRHVCKALERKRTEVAAVHATAAQEEADQQQAYTESEKYFEIVHRQAEDAAGGQALLERRLKDTQQKKERLLRLRRQLYEEMFACALLRQKKVELSKQLISLKNTSAARETRKNALYQLLQRTTRLRLLHRVHGHVLRAAIIPEGEWQTRQQLEEEDVLQPGKSEEERELLLLQNQEGRQDGDELLALQQQQQLSGESVENGRVHQHSTTHTQQQETEWERTGGHYNGFDETRQPKQRTVAAGDSRMHQRSAVQAQLPQRGGICVGENAAAEFSGLPLKISAGQHMDGNMGAGEEETFACGGTNPDELSLCTEPSTDGSCRRLITAKTAGEPALVTVDCRSRDGESRVCRDVDALWQLIEDAIGLSPEYSAQLHKNSKETFWSE